VVINKEKNRRRNTYMLYV